MNKPKVSICIPVYNCEKYIGEAIKSVLNQSYIDYEIIIINNASTDDTLKVIMKFCDPRIRVINNHENIGFNRNWNLALKEAMGEYIKILPADDYLLNDCLEKQVKILDSYKNVVMVGCSRVIVNEDSRIIMKRKSKTYLLSSARACIKVIRSGGNPIGEPGAVLFKRYAIDNGELFSNEFLYLIDLDFWFKLLKYGDLFMIEECLSAFRINSGSTSVTLIGKQSREYRDFIIKQNKAGLVIINIRDQITGIFMAYFKSGLRWLFYKFYLK